MSYLGVGVPACCRPFPGPTHGHGIPPWEGLDMQEWTVVVDENVEGPKMMGNDGKRWESKALNMAIFGINSLDFLGG